jgi:hypothetical protein
LPIGESLGAQTLPPPSPTARGFFYRIIRDFFGYRNRFGLDFCGCLDRFRRRILVSGHQRKLLDRDRSPIVDILLLSRGQFQAVRGGDGAVHVPTGGLGGIRKRRVRVRRLHGDRVDRPRGVSRPRVRQDRIRVVREGLPFDDLAADLDLLEVRAESGARGVLEEGFVVLDYMSRGAINHGHSLG